MIEAIFRTHLVSNLRHYLDFLGNAIDQIEEL